MNKDYYSIKVPSEIKISKNLITLIAYLGVAWLVYLGVRQTYIKGLNDGFGIGWKEREAWSDTLKVK